MKKRNYIAGVFAVIALSVMGNVTDVSAEPTVKKQQTTKKIIKIDGEIVENSAGNKNGIVTIKSKNSKLDIFYVFGKFKITGAEFFNQGDTVIASYKPVKADYDGELVSIEVKTKK
jgi:hypothetical protein